MKGILSLNLGDISDKPDFLPNFVRDETKIRGRVRPEGREYCERERRGAGVAALFSDLNITGVPIAQPKPRKKKRESPNFASLNRKMLKELETKTAAKKRALEEAETEKPLWWKPNKLREVPSKVGQLWKESPPRSKSAEPAGSSEAKKPDGTPQNPLTQLQRKQINHIQRNIASASGMRRAASSSSLFKAEEPKEGAFLKNHKAGEVPKYLRKRTQLWESERKEKEMQAKQRDGVPPGHVLLSNEEKERTLSMLKTTENELTQKYNTLPVRNDTMFLQKRKAEILKQLEEVEEAIRIFSRPKVFIKQSD